MEKSIEKPSSPNELSSNKLRQELLDCLLATASFIANNNASEQQIFKRPASITPVLLALSGGNDSTALLLALSKLAPAFGFQLIACHINHGLRGDESENDAKFCQHICERLQVQCEIIKLSALELAKAKHNHLNEDTLRQLRYSYLAKFAHARKIQFLLTAHTLDDQIETVLFRLLRGTSLSGLKGIDYCRLLNDNLQLLRPLLKISKAECQKFVDSQGFGCCNDSSNTNEIYSRNYIRHRIVPPILERFPDLSAHIDSLTEIVQAEDNYMNQIAFQLFQQFEDTDPNTWSITAFQQQPLALQRRILSYGLKNRSVEVSFKRIDEIISISNADLLIVSKPLYLNLNKHWRIKRIAETLLWQRLKDSPSHFQFEPMSLNIPSITVLPEINAELLIENCLAKNYKLEDYKEDSYSALSAKTYLQIAADEKIIFTDLSRIKPPLILRKRLPGDKIQPLGMRQLVKLKKFIHTHKNNHKNSLYSPLLLADQEEVIWLPGIGMSEKIKVTHIPSHLLRWRQSSLS